MQQQRVVEQEEKGRTPDGQKGGEGSQCWRNERNKDFSPRRLPAALSFFRDSPSLRPSLPSFPFRVRLSAVSSLVVYVGEQTGFAIKRILSRNARDQREDLTYNAQTGSLGLSTSRSVFSFSFLLPPAPVAVAVIPVIS